MTESVPRFIAQRRWWLLPLLCWGGLVGISLHNHLDDLSQQSLAVATEGARNMFRMVVLTRAWNAEHGGVYVAVDERVQPNPYLEHPRRDIVTTDGQRLTMVNPAFMTRLLAELARKQSGTAFHITSLKPIRPGNAPDQWERGALTRFEAGVREIVEVISLPGAGGTSTRQLRYMAPLLVTQPCMTCHEKQGYKIGDIRGGISVSLPFQPVEAATVPARLQSTYTHLAVFLLVASLGGLLLELLRRRWVRLGETIVALDNTRRKLESSNVALEEARVAADAANVAKSAFLANMSHEIRTPMNAIIGMAHLTLKTALSAGQRNYLQKIQGASQHLLGVINDVLDYSKIEAGKMVIEHREFDLDDLFDTVACQLGEKVASKELELVVDIDPDVPHSLVGDPLRLGQVLLNLGSNAVKFTEQGEIDIIVRAGWIQNSEAMLEFAVKDTGIGLDASQCQRLFNRFDQADNSVTRKYGGTGLGLAISKRMVELMGGQIRVASEPGAGSTFSFSARFGIGAGKAKHRLPTPDLRGRRILVVDDNENAREVIGTMLRSMTFQVTVAGSGTEAVAEVAAASKSGRPFDLAILDWQMPELDGLGTARAITSLELPQPPMMIMITAYGRDDLAAEARAVGITNVIAKPVTASTLFDALIAALGSNAAAAQPAAENEGGNTNSSYPAIAGARVLLVEDNALNQEVARDLLEDAGLRVVVAENGRVALERLADGEFDLVLMDVQMPEMDGLTATRAIRAQARLASLPVVAMTANAMSRDRQDCLDAGMNDHLAKPIDPEHLFAALGRWIAPTGQRKPSPERLSPEAAAQASIAALRGVPGLDVDGGLHLARNREKLYLSLLQRYVANQRDFASFLDAALNATDWQTAIRLAHTLKGLSGQIGAQTLRRMAELLELALKKREAPAVLDSLKNQIAESLDRLVSAIELSLPSSVIPVAAVGFDPHLFREVCANLAVQLESGNFAASHAFEAHEALLRAGLGPAFDTIKVAVHEFDYEAALGELKRAIAADMDT